MHRITTAERRRRVGDRHRLAGPGRVDDPSAIAEDLVALHSSDPATVHLSCLVRMANPSIDVVEQALYRDRRLVRHHAMRRTIWVMTPEVARRAHAAVTLKIARNERKQNVKAVAAAGVTDDPESWIDRGVAEIRTLLEADGPLGTREIGQRLPHLMVPLRYGTAKHSATLNAHTKLLQGAGFDGELLRVDPTGSWTSAEYTWTVAEDWLGQPIPGLETREAAAGLVERYLRGFGPATETDLKWWLGETATLVRNALSDIGAVAVALDDGEVGWVVVDDLEATGDLGPWVRLLPGLDATAMGWKERDWYLDPDHVPRLFDRFGNIGPTIWADGAIVGGWTQRPDGSVVHELLAELDTPHRDLLVEAIAELEAALDGAQVKPRFPSKNQKDLLAGSE